MKIHRLRRSFHHRSLATDLDRLPQHALHVSGFGRGAISFEAFGAETVFNCARHRHRLAGGFRNRGDEIGRGGFSIRAGDADEIEFSRRMVLNFSCRQCHGASDVFNLKPGERRDVSVQPDRFEFRDHSSSALRNHLRQKLVRIKQSAANGNKQPARTDAPRIVTDVCYSIFSFTG